MAASITHLLAHWNQQTTVRQRNDRQSYKNPKQAHSYMADYNHEKGIAYAIPFVVCVILSLFTNLLLLLSKTKLLDKCSVTLDILALKVCEKVSSLTNHLKKTSS